MRCLKALVKVIGGAARSNFMIADSLDSHDESPAAQTLRQGYRWLKFPDALERQYREDHRANSHRLVRLSIVVAFITSAGFALIDHWIVQAANATPTVVRFGLQLPILAICLLATVRRFYLHWYEFAIRIGLPLFGIGTVLMTSNAAPEHMPLVGARLLLVAFFCYFMLGLRMRTALICNAIVFAALLSVWTIGLIPAAMGGYLAFALLCANIIGASGAYALEHANRTAFLERLSLEEMAARDGLTRLLNRQTFEFRARGTWRTAIALQRSLAVLMIDVDYFKRYNDHYGHQAGDECLRRIAGAVRDAIVPHRDDLVARYGGEEIIALLLDRSPAEIEAVAHTIVERIAELAISHEASVVCDRVSVSVGATLPSVDASLSYALHARVADKALYAAKHQGRNRSVVLAVIGSDAELAAERDGGSRPEARALWQDSAGVLPGTAAV